METANTATVESDQINRRAPAESGNEATQRTAVSIDLTSKTLMCSSKAHREATIVDHCFPSNRGCKALTTLPSAGVGDKAISAASDWPTVDATTPFPCVDASVQITFGNQTPDMSACSKGLNPIIISSSATTDGHKSKHL